MSKLIAASHGDNTGGSDHAPQDLIRDGNGAEISVEWGYDLHTIKLTARNWRRVASGKPLSIRGKGYYYEGEFFWDYWDFGGGLEGRLVVTYGEHGGQGFDGQLKQAMIDQPPPVEEPAPSSIRKR